MLIVASQLQKSIISLFFDLIEGLSLCSTRLERHLDHLCNRPNFISWFLSSVFISFLLHFYHLYSMAARKEISFWRRISDGGWSRRKKKPLSASSSLSLVVFLPDSFSQFSLDLLIPWCFLIPSSIFFKSCHLISWGIPSFLWLIIACPKHVNFGNFLSCLLDWQMKWCIRILLRTESLGKDSKDFDRIRLCYLLRIIAVLWEFIVWKEITYWFKT